MGTMRSLKKVIMIGACVLTTAYAGDGLGFKDVITAPFRKPVAVERGYVNPDLVSVNVEKNAEGAARTFLTYADGEHSLSVPLMIGAHGPQAGDVDYVWENLNLTEQGDLLTKAWTGLTVDDRLDYASGTVQTLDQQKLESLLTVDQQQDMFATKWYALPEETRKELITEAWPALGTTYRHGLVRQELDSLLER